MFHHETSIRTLRHALRTLYSVSAPSLLYHQRLDIRNLYADLTYSSYLLHRPEHETLTLTFPRECELISKLQNNYGYKMVYYVTVNGLLTEVEITPQMTIEVNSNTMITIYTRSKPDLVITFDVFLTKPELRSRL
jgi:hypothetical protein